jgi:hypothetical protein
MAKTYRWFALILVFVTGWAGSGCGSVVGGGKAATVTAQAARIVNLATQMGRSAQATLVEGKQHATATARAKQNFLFQARTWNPFLTDNFSEVSDLWETGSDEDPELASIEWKIQNGVYRWQANAISPFVWWVAPETGPLGDFYLSVKARQLDNPEVGEYGLVFRQADEESYYLFEISEYGNYALFIHTIDGWETLLDWTQHSAISIGNTNRLAILGSGSDFIFFVNEIAVAEYSDDRLPTGEVGLLIGLSNDGDQATWEFDDFELRVP